MSEYKTCPVCHARFTQLSGDVEGCAVHGIREGIPHCSKCSEPLKAHRPSPGCPYNGWTNYETWAVKLWIDNEESFQNYWREAAQESYDESDGLSAYAKFVGTEIFTRAQKAAHKLADRLKDEHEDAANDRIEGYAPASVFSDLLNAALSEVNWYEIAESMLDDVKELEEVSE